MSLISGWMGMQQSMRLIYDNLLAAAATSVTISGLDGNRDQIYQLLLFVKSGSSSSTITSLRPNNDSGTNYGRQLLQAANTVVSASQTQDLTGIIVAVTGAAIGRLALSQTYLYAKSGNLRLGQVLLMEDINIETVTVEYYMSYVWNNSADNITSLVIVADQTNGLGVDTRIMLFALR